jgi:hypothetical protein
VIRRSTGVAFLWFGVFGEVAAVVYVVSALLPDAVDAAVVGLGLFVVGVELVFVRPFRGDRAFAAVILAVAISAAVALRVWLGYGPR